MRQVIIEVFNGRGKRVRRYYDHFYGPCLLSKEERYQTALANVKERFSKCWLGCTFKIHKGNQ